MYCKKGSDGTKMNRDSTIIMESNEATQHFLVFTLKKLETWVID